jgi:hypothetical protein
MERVDNALTLALGNYIPICAWCKKVRDDSGNWEAVEVYISSRTQSKFSHGMCPDCEQKGFL